MTTAYEIPTRSATPERFTIALSGTSYEFRLVWNRGLGVWVADIRTADGDPLVLGMALTAGTNLLKPFTHLGFVGQLVATTDGNPEEPPTFDNLGTAGRLLYLVED